MIPYHNVSNTNPNRYHVSLYVSRHIRTYQCVSRVQKKTPIRTEKNTFPPEQLLLLKWFLLNGQTTVAIRCSQKNNPERKSTSVERSHRHSAMLARAPTPSAINVPNTARGLLVGRGLAHPAYQPALRDRRQKMRIVAHPAKRSTSKALLVQVRNSGAIGSKP